MKEFKDNSIKILVSKDGIQRIKKGKKLNILWSNLTNYYYDDKMKFLKFNTTDKNKYVILDLINKEMAETIYKYYSQYLSKSKSLKLFSYVADYTNNMKYLIIVGFVAIGIIIYYFGFACLPDILKYTQKYPKIKKQVDMVTYLFITGGIGWLIIIIHNIIVTRYKYIWFDTISIKNSYFEYVKNKRKEILCFEDISLFDYQPLNPFIIIGKKSIPINRIAYWPLFLEEAKNKLNWNPDKNNIYFNADKKKFIFSIVRAVVYIIIGIIFYYKYFLPLFE